MPGHDVVNADPVTVVEPVVPGSRSDQRQGQTHKQSNNISNIPCQHGTAYRDNKQSSSGNHETRVQHADADRTASNGPSGLNGTSINARPSAKNAIWDWEAPVDKTAEALYSGYELQGELLQDQHERGASLSEFSIPHSVAGSSASWPFSVTAPPTSSSKTFAVPRLPQGATASNTVLGTKRKAPQDTFANAQIPEQKRTVRIMSDTSALSSPVESGMSGASSRPQLDRDVLDVEQARASTFSARHRAEAAVPSSLPPRKVFPIQIGDKMFRLSGASISSDAPSYFSHFFEEQMRLQQGADAIRTLYVDRDPTTFADIALHLQGYHIEPRDGPHFVKLFADAQFFSLPKLTAQLFASPIYIRIGETEFRIPRDLFGNPGDSPNYFSLGFAIFFASPQEAQAGAQQQGLQRPPSLLAPSIPSRSAKTFADLLHILKGYPVEVRSSEHRQELLRDARYFHFKGLEQRLIQHDISYNLSRRQQEITIRLEDIRQSGISFLADGTSASSSTSSTENTTTTNATAPPSAATKGPGWVYYQRPYADSEAYGLIVDINGDESTYLALAPASVATGARIGRATFFRQTLTRITSLFSVVATKMNLPVTQPLGLIMMERGAGVASMPVSPRNTGLSDDPVKVRIGPDADVILNGRSWKIKTRSRDENSNDNVSMSGGFRRTRTSQERRQRRSNARNDMEDDNDSDEDNETNDDDDDDDGDDKGDDWVVRRSQWRIRVQPAVPHSAAASQSGRSGVEVILAAVKIEAYSHERGRNVRRAFLT